jgi:hypothetical protein
MIKSKKMSAIIVYKNLTDRYDSFEYVDGVMIKDEDSLCMACTKWFDRVVGRPYDFIHIPNGGSRNALEGAKFKRMGVRAGVPDYLVSKFGLPVGYMEFKFGKNGLQDTQKAFKSYVEENFKIAVIRSFDEFKTKLKEWGVYDPTGK